MLIVSFCSVLIDLDHIPSLRYVVQGNRFGPGSRSRWHELYGLLLTLIVCFIVVLFSNELGRIMMIGFVSHFFLDMLTRPTRPFYPISEKTIFLKLAPSKLSYLIIYDLVVTVLLGMILFWSPSV